MGSGSGHAAQATRPAKRNSFATLRSGVFGKRLFGLHRDDGAFRVRCADMDHKSDQADRAISTGQLNASPRLHIQPIDVVVFHGPQGSPRFEVGFPLRCLQRLSRPYIAMLHCRWRDNSSTRGTFIPVLSY